MSAPRDPARTVPVVALVGRPNVGKSTLFNRLVGRRLALVADTPGVTRDRKEASTTLGDREVRIVDTAGLEEAAPETVEGRMRAGSETAIDQADLILFIVDARAGLTPMDHHFANWLRRKSKPVLLIANKAEGRLAATALYDSYALGLGDPIPVSAEHGEGLSDLMAMIADRLPDQEAAEAPAEAEPVVRIAVVGRPNVGKSTLVNQLLREERLITGPQPGLTRDSITVDLVDDEGHHYQIVDTAGLRRRARIEAPLEKLSVGATIQSLRMAEVVMLVIDAADGLHDQDLQIARLTEREGRACIIAMNKSDLIADLGAAIRAIHERLDRSLAQLRGIQVVPISALTRTGLNRLLPAIRAAHARWNTRIATGELNRWLEQALERHPPPGVQGKRIRLRYMTQVTSRPPTFVAFGTRTQALPESYKRYLENGLRETFHLEGTPIRLMTRSTHNPYAED